MWLTPEAVKRPSAVHADYLWAIETALRNHAIEIPFPQRDLHIRSWSPDARPQSSVDNAAHRTPPAAEAPADAADSPDGQSVVDR